MERPTTSGNHSRRGATLLELVIVIIMIFVLAGAVAPRFSDFVPAARVRKTADQFLATLRKARADSALYGIRYRFLLDTTTRKIQLRREVRPLKDPGVWSELGGDWTPAPYPDDITVTVEDLPTDPETGAVYLEFRPDGTAEKDATFTISNEKGDTRTIKVTASTAKVWIEEAVSE